MKRIVGCICALLFLCVPLSVKATSLSTSSFNGFDWAEYYLDENGYEYDGIPSSPGTYFACDDNYECTQFELVEERTVVPVSVVNPTCYYEEEYIPVLDVSDTYPLLSVIVSSDNRFVLSGMSNYPNIDFVLNNDCVTYKKKVIDLYHEDVTVPYSDNGHLIEGKVYKDVGEYTIPVLHNYNLDHYEVINDSYTLKIIEEKKETKKESVVSPSVEIKGSTAPTEVKTSAVKEEVKLTTSESKSSSKKSTVVQTDTQNYGMLLCVACVVSGVGLVLLIKFFVPLRKVS